jgi:hypothetical protein
MNTKDLAEYLRGLAPFLDSKFRADLEALCSLCDEVEADSVRKLCDTVRKLHQTQENSVARIAARVRGFKVGGGESVDALRERIASLTAADLKKLFRSLDLHPASTKSRNLELLEAYLLRGELPPGPPPAPSLDELVASYRQLESQAADLDYAEIERRFADIGSRKLTTLRGLARALGYGSSGNKSQLVSKLLRPLRKLREMQQRTSVI